MHACFIPSTGLQSAYASLWVTDARAPGGRLRSDFLKIILKLGPSIFPVQTCTKYNIFQGPRLITLSG